MQDICTQTKQISEIKSIKSSFVKIINKLYFYFKFMKRDISHRKNKGNYLHQDGKSYFLISKLVYDEK